MAARLSEPLSWYGNTCYAPRLVGDHSLPFPHVTDTAGTPRSAIAALGMATLTAARANPEKIAAYVCEH